MTNFIFKSPRRLTKNSPINPEVNLNILGQLKLLLTEQRMQRGDLKVLGDKLDRLLVDKHLQMQVEDFYADNDK